METRQRRQPMTPLVLQILLLLSSSPLQGLFRTADGFVPPPPASNHKHLHHDVSVGLPRISSGVTEASTSTTRLSSAAASTATTTAVETTARSDDDEDWTTTTTATTTTAMTSEHFDELTREIMGEDNDDALLSDPTLHDVFPLFLSWARKETVEAAQTLEGLLDRLETISTNKEAPPDLLSSRLYNIAMDAWAKSGDSQAGVKAEAILTRMKESADPNCALARTSYNIVMTAYARSGNIPRVKELLEEMENRSSTEHLTPRTNDYNVLLAAYAKVGGARQAEKVVKHMVDASSDKEEAKDYMPDLYSYNILLDAWANSGEKGSGRRAEEILTTLENRVEDKTFEPDEWTYVAVITALANSGEADVIERAEAIMKKAEQSKGCSNDTYLFSAMLNAYTASDAIGSAEKAEAMLDKLESEGIATNVMYNLCLKAWKVSGEQEAEKRAETLIERMESRSLVENVSYCTLIALYANVGTKESSRKAEKVLNTMKSNGLTPSMQTINTMINVWVRSGEIDKAIQKVSQMEEAYYETKDEDVAPTVVTYTTLMNAIAKSEDPAFLRKSVAVFDRMKAMYESGNTAARPNAFSYSILVNSIIRSRTPGSAERVEALLFEMYDMYKNGARDAKPNKVLVTTIIDHWQKSGERDAGERAEALLNWLIKVYKETGDKDFQPTQFSFGSAMNAWARNRKFGKARRARALLNQMIELYDSKVINAKPNAHCYTTVLNSCAHCENDAVEKRDAIHVAVETYKELLESDYARPNSITFTTMITVLQNLMPPCDKRTAAIAAIFQKSVDAGEVSSPLLQRLQSSLRYGELQEIFSNQGVELPGEGKLVNTNDVPEEWSVNAIQRGNNNNRNQARTRN